MKIRQIDFNEAMDLTKCGIPVFVITNTTKPVIKTFRKLSVGDAISDSEEYIFVVFERMVVGG